MTDVSAIIVSFNTRDLTLEAIRSVIDSRGVSSDVWVVDNDSSDDSVEAIEEEFPEINLVKSDTNLGFGRANNLAMDRAAGSLFLLLNSDARLQGRDDLARLVQPLLAEERIGVVGPRLESKAGELEYSARAFPTAVREFVGRSWLYRLLSPKRRASLLMGPHLPHDEPADPDWITAACMLVRREVYEQIGGFDADIFMYGEEQEWCYRIREEGWVVRLVPSVCVTHERGASSPGRIRWRVQQALRADLELLRKHRGATYAAWFWLARTLALTIETAGFAAAHVARRSPYVTGRFTGARVHLREWIRLGPVVRGRR